MEGCRDLRSEIRGSVFFILFCRGTSKKKTKIGDQGEDYWELELKVLKKDGAHL